MSHAGERKVVLLYIFQISFNHGYVSLQSLIHLWLRFNDVKVNDPVEIAVHGIQVFGFAVLGSSGIVVP